MTLSNEPPFEASNTAMKTQVTYRDLLRNPNFRLLWLGQGVTTFGSFFTRVAIPIYVYKLTGSYEQLGFSFFVSFLPTLLFGLFAGVLVDRWNRRRTMICTDILNGILLCALIAVVVSPVDITIQLGAIYTITFLTSILRELFSPARIAIFTEVVSDSELLTANSLDQSTTTFGEFMSYPLAAMALTHLGVEIAFAIDAMTFFVSALLIWQVKVQPKAPETNQTSNILQEIGEGLAIVNGAPLLRKIVILSLIVPLTFTLLATLQLPFAVEELGSTEEIGFPALEGVMALGLLTGTLLLGKWGQHIARWKLLASGMLSFGLIVTCFGLVPRIGSYLGLPPSDGDTSFTPLLLLAMPMVFVQGATNSLIVTCIRTVMQEETPRELVGRVASVVMVAAGVSTATGALLTGFSEGIVDTVITSMGVIVAVIGLFSMWWLRVPAKPKEPKEPIGSKEAIA